MKAKSLVLSAIASLTLSTAAIAQFSARLDLGYGLPSGTQTMITWDNSGNQKVTPYSFGSGFNIALAGNYMFNSHIGAGLDFNMLFGTPFKIPGQSQLSDIAFLNNTNTTATSSLFSITPNLILSAHREGINPYARFGIVLGIPSFTFSTTATGPGAPSGTNVTLFSENLALGWYAAFGVQFPVAQNLSLNVELFDRDITYAPGMLTNPQTYVGYQKHDSETLVTSINSSSASNTQLTSYYPFGSVGIKVGVEVNFGK